MRKQAALRNLIMQEKELNNENKKLYFDWKREKEEFQNEMNEKQAQIQKLKEKLVKTKAKARI